MVTLYLEACGMRSYLTLTEPVPFSTLYLVSRGISIRDATYVPSHSFTPHSPPCWLRGRDWGRTAGRLSGIGRFGRLLPLLRLLFPFSFAVGGASAVGTALLVGEYIILIQWPRSQELSKVNLFMI